MIRKAILASVLFGCVLISQSTVWVAAYILRNASFSDWYHLPTVCTALVINVSCVCGIMLTVDNWKQK